MTDPNDDSRSLRESLGDAVDLDAWEPNAPPADFSERVLTAMKREPKVRVQRRRLLAVTTFAALAAVAAAFALKLGNVSEGDATASAREEVDIGRGIAVLERGAHVSWKGDLVVQSAGDVFYRVERGGKFRVKTPAGDVTVLGTCFRVRVTESGDSEMQKRDVKSGVIGAAATALAIVSVYEGKVAVSHAAESVTILPGESARAGADGVHKDGDPRATSAAMGGDDDALAEANKNLVDSVSDYRKKLDALAAEKKDVEGRLATAEKKLAATDPHALEKNAFDLTPSDWAELAKDGTVKFRVPCLKAWQPGANDLDRLGLAPADASTIENAYKQSAARLWGVIKPLCAQVVGSPEIAERIGPDSCIHVVVDAERSTNRAAADQAMYDVGLIRAGEKPAPELGANVNPVLAMFLALTDSTGAFERDLSQSFGPDEAHRLAYADGMCAGTHSFGGPGVKH